MLQSYVLYDRGQIDLHLPDGTACLVPDDPPVQDDPQAAVRDALARPIGCEAMIELARRADHGGTAIIVISDITRPVPNSLFVPIIIEQLEQAGFESSHIRILIATGMHRPSTADERDELLGPEIARRYTVIDHRADDPDEVVRLDSRTRAGTAVCVNRHYQQASFSVVTGFIEPHFMAGFSGGRKGICPGLVDLATIEKFHGYAFLADPHARMGCLDGNPCHAEALDVARAAGCDFLVNVTTDRHKRVCGVFAGDLEQAHQAGVQQVRQHMTVRTDCLYDTVITCNGGYPLDVNYYQCGKGQVAASMFVKPGGRIICAAACSQGIGSDSYRDIMFRYQGRWREFLADIASSDTTELDQWGFQVQAQLFDRLAGKEGFIVVSDGLSDEDIIRSSAVPASHLVGSDTPARQLQMLVDMYAEQGSMAILPHGPYLLPQSPSTQP